jgi:predicted PurR-regulated permease PerM
MLNKGGNTSTTEQALAPAIKPLKTHSRMLRGLFALALMYTLYFAQSLLMPLLVTLLIALLLSPLVALLKRIYIPRAISALLLLTILVGPFTILGIELAEPAQRWIKLLPKLTLQITEQVDSISDAMQGSETVNANPLPKASSGFTFFGLFSDDEEEEKLQQALQAQQSKDDAKKVVAEKIKQTGVEAIVSLLGATPVILVQLMTGLILILFLLIFGPALFTAYISSVAGEQDKQKVVYLIAAIQKELSRYIFTVSVINLGLGLCTGLTLAFLGMEDAVLWGVLVGLLNFAPYVGSLIGVGILTLAGLAQYGMQFSAFVPTLVYLFFNLLESQFVTPTILGSRMRLNPLIVMIWLLMWGWLWGAMGVLLAVPLLVCIKLIIAQLGYWPHWLKIIETQG